MLQFISLASGSSGNCYYFNCNGYGLLIDLGIGIRAFRRTCSNYGVKLADVRAILVTHDHTDHVKAVGVLSQTFHLPVYATERVHRSMKLNHFISKKVPPALQYVIEKQKEFSLGPFAVTPFNVPHDSADNNGYILRADGKCVVLMTDIGHFTEEMPGIVGQADYLIVESNYDEAMLAAGRYPVRLQQRIRGGYGHTSNRQTAAFLADHLNPRLIRRVWLCHLSAENNLPRLALQASADALRSAGFPLDEGALKVEPLGRRTPSLMYEL